MYIVLCPKCIVLQTKRICTYKIFTWSILGWIFAVRAVIVSSCLLNLSNNPFSSCDSKTTLLIITFKSTCNTESDLVTNLLKVYDFLFRRSSKSCCILNTCRSNWFSGIASLLLCRSQVFGT